MFALRRVVATQKLTVARLAARSFSDNSLLTLNFAMPHGTIYANEPVELVRLTSCIGEYGVTAGHTPNVSQLAPGLAQVYKTKDAAPDVYFVSGSFFFSFFFRFFFFRLPLLRRNQITCHLWANLERP